MDLIKQLISVKKSDSLPLKEILTELIKYEKLSKSDKFKHITDSPVLQKQLPYCWSAFQNNPQAYWILNEASTIIQTVAQSPLVIFDDLANRYKTKKEREQLSIIGNAANHIQFQYTHLTAITDDYKNENHLILTEMNNDRLYISIIVGDAPNITVYTGDLPLTSEEIEQPVFKGIPVHTYEQDGDYVKIQNISNQGNNDYNFAKTKSYDVSMPDSNHFCYTPIPIQHAGKDVKLPSTIVEVDDTDIQLYHIKRDDLDVISRLILKYKPVSFSAADISVLAKMKARKTEETKAEKEV